MLSAPSNTVNILYILFIHLFRYFFFYLFICLFSLEKFCTLSYRFCLIKFKRKFDKQNLGKIKIKTTTMTTKSYSVSTINWAVQMFIKFQTHGTCFAFEHRFEILEIFLIINRFFGLSNWIFFSNCLEQCNLQSPDLFAMKFHICAQ